MNRGTTPTEDDARGFYEEGVITAVAPPQTPDGWWSISYGQSWGCGMPSGSWTPKVGDTLRVYGPWGFPFHGQALNGVLLWYKSPEQMEAERQVQIAKMALDRAVRFEAEREKLDRDFEALPPALKQRIKRFRSADPAFRVESESYEMFCCTQATLLADWAKQQPEPAAAVTEWAAKRYEDQVADVPGWSDQHSGNTHGGSIALARALIERVAV